VAPSDAVYTCPMHPQIQQIGPGSCPICGMALEPLVITGEEEANPELADMTRRFWASRVLTTPLLLLAMGEIAERHDLVIVMDEAHENLVFDGRRHVSAASLGALRERTVTLFSMTKAHNLTGYRIGYLVGNAALIDQVAKMVEWSVLLNPYLPQLAAKAVLEGPQDWLEDMIRLAERNRNVVSAALDELEGVSHVRPAGGMYHFINVRGTGLTDLELYRRLLREHGIPTEPGWISGEAGHLRLTALGSPEAVVDELAHRLRIAWQKL